MNMKQQFIDSLSSKEIVCTCTEDYHVVHSTLLSDAAKYLENILPSCSHNLCDIYWLDSLNLFIVLLVIICLVSIWKPRVKAFLLRHLKLQAFFIWLCGIAIYMVGFNKEGSAESNIALMLRSYLSSMEMFVSHSDLKEVRQELHEDATYMALFSLIHFCAVAISAIFILRLFGFKIVSWIKVMWLCLWDWMNFKRYYVMFGVNDNTITLAKSIAGSNKNDCIIFVNLPDKECSHATTRFSFSHFFHAESNAVDKYIEDIENMGAMLFNSSRSFDNANVCFPRSDVFKVFRALEFSWIVRTPLQKLLRNAAHRKKVEFYFLSGKEQDNLIAISTLNKLQKEQLSKNCSFDCYCHARKNRNNSALLNDGKLAFRAHIIDTSNLAILELKKNRNYHPVNFVNKGEISGTVSSTFTGMVIGFGETGRDAFRFLYEFSAFPKDDEGNPSERNIYIVDKDIDGLKADFLNEAPALRNKPELDWWQMPVGHSERFWVGMKEVIQKLNYIVITVANDEEAAKIATSIFEFAYRYRNNLDNFKIFVRLRQSIQKNFLRSHREFLGIIIPFGADRTAFIYEVINNDVLEKKAKLFYYQYEKEIEKKEDNMGEKETLPTEKEEIDKLAAEMWEKRRDGYRNEEKDYSKRKNNEIKVWYQEEQDRSNAWHIYTKVALANKDTTSDNLKSESNKRLLRNLSNCEHLRWNAKMELLGFEPATNKDIPKAEVEKANRSPWKSFKLRKHECLAGCKTLHANPILVGTIPYDESVVELSFKMEEEEGIEAHLKW